MATNESTGNEGRSRAGGFQISDGPVVWHQEGDQTGIPSELGELPRVYGIPLLFAIARDPRTLFTYWNINWSSVLANTEPVGHQVYLRVKREDGTNESESAVEPMLGSYYARVAQPCGSYRVELGYYEPAENWRRVASSETVTMPPESVSENVEVDLVTVPFHLSFQRLIDLFRASNSDALMEIISRLQNRAVTEADRTLLSAEEWEILRAMNLSLPEMDEARHAFADRADNDLLRKRAEAILGFGATSPMAGPGGSSWSSDRA
jgi:hypothetical protein